MINMQPLIRTLAEINKELEKLPALEDTLQRRLLPLRKEVALQATNFKINLGDRANLEETFNRTIAEFASYQPEMAQFLQKLKERMLSAGYQKLH